MKTITINRNTTYAVKFPITEKKPTDREKAALKSIMQSVEAEFYAIHLRAVWSGPWRRFGV